MKDRIDEVLAAIDAGLQTAGDTAYGTDQPGICWRCRQPSPTDLCEACRAILLAEAPLENTDDDAALDALIAEVFAMIDAAMRSGASGGVILLSMGAVAPEGSVWCDTHGWRLGARCTRCEPQRL